MTWRTESLHGASSGVESPLPPEAMARDRRGYAPGVKGELQYWYEQRIKAEMQRMGTLPPAVADPVPDRFNPRPWRP